MQHRSRVGQPEETKMDGKFNSSAAVESKKYKPQRNTDCDRTNQNPSTIFVNGQSGSQLTESPYGYPSNVVKRAPLSGALLAVNYSAAYSVGAVPQNVTQLLVCVSPTSSRPSLSNVTVSLADVSALIQTLKDPAVSEDDGKPSRAPRHGGQDVKTLVLNLSNHPTKSVLVPSYRKQSIVRPLFKSGLRHTTSNYRGIHHIPILLRTLECLVKGPLIRFPPATNALDDRYFELQQYQVRTTCLAVIHAQRVATLSQNDLKCDVRYGAVRKPNRRYSQMCRKVSKSPYRYLSLNAVSSTNDGKSSVKDIEPLRGKIKPRTVHCFMTVVALLGYSACCISTTRLTCLRRPSKGDSGELGTVVRRMHLIFPNEPLSVPGKLKFFMTAPEWCIRFFRRPLAFFRRLLVTLPRWIILDCACTPHLQIMYNQQAARSLEYSSVVAFVLCHFDSNTHVLRAIANLVQLICDAVCTFYLTVAGPSTVSQVDARAVVNVFAGNSQDAKLPVSSFTPKKTASSFFELTRNAVSVKETFRTIVRKIHEADTVFVPARSRADQKLAKSIRRLLETSLPDSLSGPRLLFADYLKFWNSNAIALQIDDAAKQWSLDWHIPLTKSASIRRSEETQRTPLSWMVGMDKKILRRWIPKRILVSGSPQAFPSHFTMKNWIEKYSSFYG
ncbi:hypothetical protein CLF_113041 [Clonorchis sinensis]|uniref:Uncharacterized protein n=1 Tax=Clonorchis sinensis TaxID=79923 RepID=G7YXI3_CLOSI|nr:hypothetical protein CLF_113041 [Clonorchis sinensis]